METDLKKIVGHRLQMLRMEKESYTRTNGRKVELINKCLL